MRRAAVDRKSGVHRPRYSLLERHHPAAYEGGRRVIIAAHDQLIACAGEKCTDGMVKMRFLG
ncbi:hypothetical protein KCP70_20150 [Salmonella enterica subsp. enterica]|nr:hypothetical protein KCP70_20150 [Salmonella enterica subsp. enterica]